MAESKRPLKAKEESKQPPKGSHPIVKIDEHFALADAMYKEIKRDAPLPVVIFGELEKEQKQIVKILEQLKIVFEEFNKIPAVDRPRYIKEQRAAALLYNEVQNQVDEIRKYKVKDDLQISKLIIGIEEIHPYKQHLKTFYAIQSKLNEARNELKSGNKELLTPNKAQVEQHIKKALINVGKALKSIEQLSHEVSDKEFLTNIRNEAVNLYMELREFVRSNDQIFASNPEHRKYLASLEKFVPAKKKQFSEEAAEDKQWHSLQNLKEFLNDAEIQLRSGKASNKADAFMAALHNLNDLAKELKLKEKNGPPLMDKGKFFIEQVKKEAARYLQEIKEQLEKRDKKEDRAEFEKLIKTLDKAFPDQVPRVIIEELKSFEREFKSCVEFMLPIYGVDEKQPVLDNKAIASAEKNILNALGHLHNALNVINKLKQTGQITDRVFFNYQNHLTKLFADVKSYVDQRPLFRFADDKSGSQYRAQYVEYIESKRIPAMTPVLPYSFVEASNQSLASAVEKFQEVVDNFYACNKMPQSLAGQQFINTAVNKLDELFPILNKLNQSEVLSNQPLNDNDKEIRVNLIKDAKKYHLAIQKFCANKNLKPGKLSRESELALKQLYPKEKSQRAAPKPEQVQPHKEFKRGQLKNR